MVHHTRRDKWPATHIVRVERVAQAIWRKRHSGSEPDHTHGEIEPARESVKGSSFRVVDAAEAVGLHQAMPNAPEENDQQNSLQVPPEEGRADREKKQRRENETPFEAFKQCAVAIRADHPWQVMSHCAECSDKEINVLGTPARLGQRKHRHQQQRGADVENKVAPRIQNLECITGCSRWTKLVSREDIN